MEASVKAIDSYPGSLSTIKKIYGHTFQNVQNLFKLQISCLDRKLCNTIFAFGCEVKFRKKKIQNWSTCTTFGQQKEHLMLSEHLVITWRVRLHRGSIFFIKQTLLNRESGIVNSPKSFKNAFKVDLILMMIENCVFTIYTYSK